MTSTTQAGDAVSEPFPIYTLAHKYMLYDVNVVSYVRAKYNIIGVLMGGLPQAPQQNVFLGIPLELMPEEARLLVEKGVAFIVDDVKAHRQGFMGNGMSTEERKAFQSALSRQGIAAAKDAERKGEDRKKEALNKKFGTSDWNDIPEDMLVPSAKRTAKKGKKPGSRLPASDGSEGSRAPSGTATPAEDEDSLFAPSMNSSSASRPPKAASRSSSLAPSAEPIPYAVTPTTSTPPLTPAPPRPDEALPPPDVPASYPLFKHLHEKSYFLAPGLRFGCQYMAYPGDPLRFHSHFLCNGMDWDQEFDLLDLVGGGRLGTGVKKGFLIGGEEKDAVTGEVKGNDVESEGKVRTFCVEWGGM